MVSRSKNIKIKTSDSYPEFLSCIKQKIQQAKISAIRHTNRELIKLYWAIGKEITERQDKLGWGKSIIEKLSKDLNDHFPGMAGFSARNLWDMRRFYNDYKDKAKLRQLVAEINWGQNLLILNKIKDLSEREYYIKAVIENGWSRDVLLNQINADAYSRHVKSSKQNNFERTLPVHFAEQAEKTMKDVYILDFLGITRPVLENVMEQRMVEKIKDVILELGCGFAFMGNQYKIKLNEKEYFIDLLFYHRKLKCLVAIELKTGEFMAEYAGKMNLYLNILDDFVRENGENPSIGIILCAERDRIEVEYTLRGIEKPVGVAEYRLTKKLPKELAGKLPDPKTLEKQILEELKNEK